MSDWIHPEAPAGLASAVHAALQASPARILRLEQPIAAIIKRQAPVARGRLQSALVAVLLRVLVGRWPDWSALRLEGNREQVEHEVNRLQQLQREGLNVAPVLMRGDGWFVMRHTGEHAEEFLERQGREALQPWLDRIAADLGQWHRQGQWHGAGQLRNVTIDAQGQLTRIDFEEQLEGLAPLALLQFNDWLLMRHAAARFLLRLGVPGAQIASLLASQETAYRKGRGLVALPPDWQRPLRWLMRAAWLLQRLGPRAGRDGRALVLACEGLSPLV